MDISKSTVGDSLCDCMVGGFVKQQKVLGFGGGVGVGGGRCMRG